MNMVERKKQYMEGAIEKHNYVEEMYEFHKILEEYAELLKNSSIDNILITKEGVSFNIKGTKRVKINHIYRDKYDIPLQYLNFGGYEEEEYALIRGLLNEGDVILDIGANVGWYALNLLNSMHNIQVHSFEPLPQNYHNLLENFKLNEVEPKNVYNIGLYNENTELEFYFDIENSMASSLTNLRDLPKTEKYICTARRLDDFINEKKINHVDFIKCDVEGAELFVFQGAIETLKKNKPIVLSEMLRKWAAKFSYHPNDIISLFKKLDYQCFSVVNAKLECIEEVNSNTAATNFLFLHTDNHKDLIANINKKELIL